MSNKLSRTLAEWPGAIYFPLGKVLGALPGLTTPGLLGWRGQVTLDWLCVPGVWCATEVLQLSVWRPSHPRCCRAQRTEWSGGGGNLAQH